MLRSWLLLLLHAHKGGLALKGILELDERLLYRTGTLGSRSVGEESCAELPGLGLRACMQFRVKLGV